jgi:PHP family Zn ribbon phosphoesterase
MFLRSVIDVATVKPALEVADILRVHFDEYLQDHHCTAEELAAVNAIIKCRTAALGGHVRQCDRCSKIQIAYNSCNNRHCPKCGGFEKAQSFGKAQEQVSRARGEMVSLSPLAEIGQATAGRTSVAGRAESPGGAGKQASRVRTSAFRSL